MSLHPILAPKSTWKPTKGHPNLEVFLIQIEKELFEAVETSLRYLKKNVKLEEHWRMIGV